MGRSKNELVDWIGWAVHTGSGLADAESTKSGMDLMLTSDGAYKLASD